MLGFWVWILHPSIWMKISQLPLSPCFPTLSHKLLLIGCNYKWSFLIVAFHKFSSPLIFLVVFWQHLLPLVLLDENFKLRNWFLSCKWLHAWKVEAQIGWLHGNEIIVILFKWSQTWPFWWSLLSSTYVLQNSTLLIFVVFFKCCDFNLLDFNCLLLMCAPNPFNLCCFLLMSVFGPLDLHHPLICVLDLLTLHCLLLMLWTCPSLVIFLSKKLSSHSFDHVRFLYSLTTPPPHLFWILFLLKRGFVVFLQYVLSLSFKLLALHFF